jgi:predicted RNA-binding protein with PUA-like domain
MATFLLKTEPGTFSFDDLARAGKTAWDGVSNAAALAFLRTMRPGDEAFIYHTGDEKAVVGLARVAGSPREDPARPGRTAAGDPKFAVVDLEAVRSAETPLTLGAVRGDARFAGFPLVTQPRLSVMPVPRGLDATIRKLTGL